MHLLTLMRGEIHHVKKFIDELSTRYLPFDFYNSKTKQKEKRLLQLRVCPIQLFDISFPEEHKDAVLTTCLVNNEGSINKYMDKFFWAMRKGMKLEPIPEYKKDSWLAMSPPQNIELIGIGVKKDKWITEEGKIVEEKDKTENSYEGI